MSNNIVNTKQQYCNYKIITQSILRDIFFLFTLQKTKKHNMYTQCNYITNYSSSLNKISHKKQSNHNVITNILYPLFSNIYKTTFFFKKICNYFVITKQHICYYIVITFCFILLETTSSWATTQKNTSLKIYSPITEAGLIYGQIQSGTELFYQNKKIPTDKGGYFVLALPQDTDATLTLTTTDHKNTHEWIYAVQQRHWKEEVVNGLPPQKVSPSKEDFKRITTENTLLKQARSSTLYTKMPFCFSRPVDKSARISSEFGARRILNGTKTAGHSGTDYALPIGTPIYAPADGIIKLLHHDMFYSGKTILIDHGFGIFSSYSHLNTISVEQGDIVKRKDKIGEIGTTGRSTGPHLHFTLTWFGVRVDPEFALTQYSCDE